VNLAEGVEPGTWAAGPLRQGGGRLLHWVRPKGYSACGRVYPGQFIPDPGTGLAYCGGCERAEEARLAREGTEREY
jgi:hypothetical protein